MSTIERIAVLAPGVEVDLSRIDVLKYSRRSLPTSSGACHRYARGDEMSMKRGLENAYCIVIPSPAVSRVATFSLVAHLLNLRVHGLRELLQAENSRGKQ